MSAPGKELDERMAVEAGPALWINDLHQNSAGTASRGLTSSTYNL